MFTQKILEVEKIIFVKNMKNQKKILDILKKYPSDLPKDLEDLISDAESAK